MKQTLMIIKIFAILFFLKFNNVCFAQDLQRATPESQGISSEVINNYLNQMMNLNEGETHGIIILRHGRIIGELFPKPFSYEYKHTLYSASKTFVAAAIGIAIDEKLISLTDSIVSFFPDKLPDIISPELKSITIRNLLTMTTGIKPDWTMRNKEAEWIKNYLNKPIQSPSNKFQYDSMSSYLLSAILQQVTGKKLIDYLNEKLFFPMKITDAEWEESPEGINTGGWGLYIQVESMAKFGQLLLNKGRWNEKQLISQKWIEEMTSTQQITNMKDNYGYQTWICDYPNVFRADGAMGQYIIVAPNEDMVFAITQANRSNGIAERELVWNVLRNVQNYTLAESTKQLPQKKYHLPYVVGEKESKSQKLLNKTEILLNKNDLNWQNLCITQGKGSLNLIVTTEEGDKYTIRAEYNDWKTVAINTYPPYSIKALDRFKGICKNFYVAANYGWISDNELQVNIRYPNWISGADLSFIIKENQLEVWVKETCKKTKYKVANTTLGTK